MSEEAEIQETSTQRRSSSTCVFEDLENKNCNEVPSLPESPLNKELGGNNLAESSAVSTVSINGDMCKICHCGGEANVSLIAPCYCSGSLKYVHQECLQRWIKSSDIKRCELCKYPFAMQAKVKPFCQWEKLDMTALERRKLFCSVTFHVVAITCVVWSLYVLIDRTAEEIRNGELQWPFWTKLVVVAIGFTGGLVFMYIQCKVYVHLCRKWKAYNRTIVVQDAPEGVHKPSDRQLTTPSTKGSNFITVNNGSSHAESASSRRSSSAPSSSTPAASSAVSSRDAGTEKTNAETQTALRGVAILENECGHAHSLGHTSEAIFFTECECNLKVVKSNEQAEKSGQRQLGSELLNSTHSTSTPNMLHSSTKMTSSAACHSGHSRPSNNPRKYSLSPVRKTPASPSTEAGAPLPGSPLDAFDTLKTEANHHSTVLSPVKTSSSSAAC